jgi:hypothetical protein
MVLRVRVERGVESALPHRDVVGRSPPDHVPYRTAPARRDMLGWVPELEGENALPGRVLFSETRIQPVASLCDRTGPMEYMGGAKQCYKKAVANVR